jgi:hypothetical protein
MEAFYTPQESCFTGGCSHSVAEVACAGLVGESALVAAVALAAAESESLGIHATNGDDSEDEDYECVLSASQEALPFSSPPIPIGNADEAQSQVLHVRRNALAGISDPRRPASVLNDFQRDYSPECLLPLEMMLITPPASPRTEEEEEAHASGATFEELDPIAVWRKTGRPLPTGAPTTSSENTPVLSQAELLEWRRTGQPPTSPKNGASPHSRDVSDVLQDSEAEMENVASDCDASGAEEDEKALHFDMIFEPDQHGCAAISQEDIMEHERNEKVEGKKRPFDCVCLPQGGTSIASINNNRRLQRGTEGMNITSTRFLMC